MLTRYVTGPVRRGPLGAGRAVRAGLALAAVGIAVVGATGGVASASPGQRNWPAPDGGPTARAQGPHAADGDRNANDRPAGRTPAPVKAKSTAKTRTAAKAKAVAQAKAKARARAVVAQRSKVTHKSAPKPDAKAPVTAPLRDLAGTVTIAGAPAAPPAPVAIAPPAAPADVAAVASAASVLTVSWTVNTSETGIVDHFVVTATEDPSKTCRTRTNAATSCAVPSLPLGARYTFTVRAIGVPGAGNSGSSIASAPATVADPTVADSSDGLIVTPDTAKPAAMTAGGTAGTAGSAGTALSSVRIVADARHAAKARTTNTTRGSDMAQDNGKAQDNEKIRGNEKVRSRSDGAVGKALGGATGGRMALPDGGVPAVAAVSAATGRSGGRRTRTGAFMLLGFGVLAATVAAVGVTRGRRRPLPG